MSETPVNVFLSSPTVPIEAWNEQDRRWARLNVDVGGDDGFYPLTVKAFFVFGVQLANFWSVSSLLKEGNLPDITYLPAFALFASGVELLGRCLRGNIGTSGSTADLIAGLKWLASPDFDRYESVLDAYELVSTSNASYSISQLVALRRYAAHGQGAVIQGAPPLDFLILQEMPLIISPAMEAYWDQLQRLPAPCNALAKANVAPIRSRPIFDTLWTFSRRERGRDLAIGEIFGRLDWTYKVARPGGWPSG
jgi:hypothetical protein